VGVDPETTCFAYYTESRQMVEALDSIDELGPVDVEAEHQARLIKALLDAWDLRVSRADQRAGSSPSNSRVPPAKKLYL
jgi:hypothetical protein